MFGLKGNNVKLSSKPSSTHCKIPKINSPSPYYQEEHLKSEPRRIQSATNTRIPAKPKVKNIHRKHSEPIIQPPRIIQPKVKTPTNEGGGDASWSRVRPLSASSKSENSELHHSFQEIETNQKSNQEEEFGIEDELLLSESDNLLQDVVFLCDEIGLESSLIETIRKSRSSIGSDGMDEDEISLPENNSKINEKIIQEIKKLSRPNSAASSNHRNDESFHNVQNQAISRIISTLRLIEDEEKKGCEMAAQFGDFFRQKLSPTNLANSPSPVSRPVSSLSSTHSYNRCSAGDCTPRFQKKDTTPRLPPIHNSRPGSAQNNFPSARNSDHYEDQPSQRSPRKVPFGNENYPPPSPRISGETTTDEKARNIFTFLDEVERSDRDILFNLKFDCAQTRRDIPSIGHTVNSNSIHGGIVSYEFPAPTMDTLIRKGSVELAREVILLERKVEEISQNISILEETLMSQRELNIRNIRNSQRDLKKRLKIQQEEFELALSRHQAFVDQLIAEKRGLQDKCEKVLKDSKESEQRYQQQVKSLQEKHLEELKRMRKLQDNVEKTRKQKWVGTKTQEIRDMTVKGLEPELQRIIQRHQQEMSEMRAWHADELRETEERYSRKQTMHLQEIRETFNREKDEACRRERELSQKRFDSDLKRLNDDFESQKSRLFQEIQEEKEKFSFEESKLKDLMHENARKSQIKGEVEMEAMKQEYDSKIINLEKKHENELKSLKDNYENQRENIISTNTKKHELIMAERESILHEQFQIEKDKEIKEKDKKLKDEFKKLWIEEEQVQEARIKRMQDKFQFELEDLEKSEFELKQKFSKLKSETLSKEEEIFTLKTTTGLKEKQIHELNESNMKMLEERINLTSIIRREFSTQIEELEKECNGVKSAVLELRAKQKLDLESHQIELEKIRGEKDVEMEKISVRVKHALLRKEEAIGEFQKQLEKSQIRINHLEQLLEQQRKDFVSSITANESISKRK